MIIKIQFRNRTNGSIIEIECSWDSASFIIEWYGSHHSGDTWSWEAGGEGK